MKTFNKIKLQLARGVKQLNFIISLVCKKKYSTYLQNGCFFGSKIKFILQQNTEYKPSTYG